MVEPHVADQTIIRVTGRPVVIVMMVRIVTGSSRVALSAKLRPLGDVLVRVLVVDGVLQDLMQWRRNERREIHGADDEACPAVHAGTLHEAEERRNPRSAKEKGRVFAVHG
jgi:hypothetical protein